MRKSIRILITSSCQTTLNYTAIHSWDRALYSCRSTQSFANSRQVSEASFRLRGNRRLVPNKWCSTEMKINELVD